MSYLLKFYVFNYVFETCIISAFAITRKFRTRFHEVQSTDFPQGNIVEDVTAIISVGGIRFEEFYISFSQVSYLSLKLTSLNAM